MCGHYCETYCAAGYSGCHLKSWIGRGSHVEQDAAQQAMVQGWGKATCNSEHAAPSHTSSLPPSCTNETTRSSGRVARGSLRTVTATDRPPTVDVLPYTVARDGLTAAIIGGTKYSSVPLASSAALAPAGWRVRMARPPCRLAAAGRRTRARNAAERSFQATCDAWRHIWLSCSRSGAR